KQVSNFVFISMAHSSSLSAPLKCSVCLDVCMPGEIQQCKNGHNICASHLPHLRDCPICRIPFSHGLARNLVAEYLVGLPVERRSQQVEDMARKIASIVTTPTVHSSHLITTHNVKCFEGSPCLIIYYVKEDRKLVQDGPTDLVILEVDKNKFLVRAKQVEDRVYIWVAFHGAPQDGCKYMATIKFDFPDDDDDCRKIQENGGDMKFSGIVQATTRMTVDDVEKTDAYLDMCGHDIENNLGQEIVRRQRVNSWGVNVNISRS
ncbi:E3 ubiquitin-protein ligase sina, partial [Folsomia candida]